MDSISFHKNQIDIKNELTLKNISQVLSIFEKELEQCAEKNILVNLSKLEIIDSAGIATLDQMFEIAQKRNIVLKMQDVPEHINNSIKTFSTKNLKFSTKKDKTNIFEILGQKYYDGLYFLRDFLYLTADTFYWAILGLFSKKGQRKGALIAQSNLIGVDAFPIVTLISFLIGFILALQSAAQLRQFGANIFVADLIAISMTREMGPIMTAIVLAGRSGSSIASEIATMKVTEELDALKTMAINPIKFIVLPKLYAMTLCMPLLTISSIVLGIFGGILIGVFYLELSLQAFLNQIANALHLKDIITGLIKSIVFAWIIVLIAVFYGFRVKGGAEGVGKVTTSSVVASIFMVIVADSLMGLIFYF